MKDILVSLIVSLLMILLDALFCFWAWNGFAWEFNLPTFNFWHWACTLMAVRALFGVKLIKKGE